MTDRIEITGVDLRKFIKEVYALSQPQGMGFLHYQGGDLPEDKVDEILARGRPDCPVAMDYVIGRACKMFVRAEDGKLFIAGNWYDHTDAHLRELLDRCGIERKAA